MIFHFIPMDWMIFYFKSFSEEVMYADSVGNS